MMMMIFGVLEIGHVCGKKSSENTFSSFESHKDPYSKSLTSRNFIETLKSSPLPWFIYLGYPKYTNTELSVLSWIKFGELIEKSKLDLKIGKINLSREKDLRQVLNCTKNKAYIYISEGYAYNYIGSKNLTSLSRVHTEKTYLQYERLKLDLTDLEDLKSGKVKLAHGRKPVISLIRTFILAFIIQALILWLCCGTKLNTTKLKTD